MSGLLWAVISAFGAAVITGGLYVVWRVRQLGRRVAAHDKALRLSETDGELDDGRRRRHLRAIPVVAALAGAGAWLRDHGGGRPALTAAVAFVGAAALLVAIWPHAPARPGAVPPSPAPPPFTGGPPSTSSTPPPITTTTSSPPAGPVRVREARPTTVRRPRSTTPAPPPATARPSPTSPPTTTAPPKARPDDDGGDKKRRPGTCVWVWHDPVAEAQVCNG